MYGRIKWLKIHLVIEWKIQKGGSEMSAYSEKEVRDKFLRKIKSITDCWSNYEGKSSKERCEGVAFSILALIDGCLICY